MKFLRPFYGLSILVPALTFAQVHGDSAGPAKYADVSKERLRKAELAPGEGKTNGRGFGATFFSPLTQMNAGTVSRLGFSWQFKTDTYRGMEATPIVVD